MRVLLVEDDPTTSKSIELMLTHANLNVYCTDLGEEGIDLAKLYDYDLILLDLNMPHKNGMEVLDELKNNLDKVPAVLMITAQTAIEYRQKALTSGARDYITKPFDIVELLARVKNQVEVEIYHKALSGENSYLESLVNEKTRRLLDAQKEL